jgi:hypothetical protein
VEQLLRTGGENTPSTYVVKATTTDLTAVELTILEGLDMYASYNNTLRHIASAVITGDPLVGV